MNLFSRKNTKVWPRSARTRRGSGADLSLQASPEKRIRLLCANISVSIQPDFSLTGSPSPYEHLSHSALTEADSTRCGIEGNNIFHHCVRYGVGISLLLF